jgi:hypothetical protein
VGQQLLVVAAGVQKGVGEDAEAGWLKRAVWKTTLVVGCLSQTLHEAVAPSKDGG